MILLIAAAGVLVVRRPGVAGLVADRGPLVAAGRQGHEHLAVRSAALIAVALLVWSYRKFHGNPEAIAEVEAAAKADDDREGFWGR